MAQSKAQAFKDDYTKGVMDGAVQQRIADETEMAFGALPETDMGNQAGVLIDLNRNVMETVNDGNPYTYTVKGNGYRADYGGREIAYPNDSKPAGARSDVLTYPTGTNYERRVLDHSIDAGHTFARRGLAPVPQGYYAPSYLSDNLWSGGSSSYRQLKNDARRYMR